jgi:DNA ligase D-like protein (predicted 3'-phosphoesterase)
VADLERYQGKRDFSATAEPRGRRHASTGDPHFVIQHHLATADHYDFRLEIDGVLVSWAVPKGPSTDPKVKRMAVRTEDHPLDYETFEGTIGTGQYGHGVVQVWDRGTFRNTSTAHGTPVSAADGLQRGHISFELAGEKLQGGYALNRLHEEKRETWLLVKKAGAGADARRNPTSTQPESVLTGRTLDEIADKADD